MQSGSGSSIRNGNSVRTASEQKSTTLRLAINAHFYPVKQASQPQHAPTPPLNQTPAAIRSKLDQHTRSRVFAVIGHNRVGSVNTQHLRSLMREVVTWIPDFTEFSSLCTEGMHKAWLHDRGADVPTRTTRTTRAQWIRLFRYFALRHRIDADIRIRATNKGGHYVCELAPRRKEIALWRELFRLGKELGATSGELNRLKAQVEARAEADTTTDK